MIGFLRPILLAAAVTVASTAAAHERVSLERGRLTDSELEIMKSYFADHEDPIEELAILEGMADTPEEAWQAVRRDWLYGGHYDFDGDGRRELVVYIGTACGNVGCQTVILRQQDEAWSEYLWLSVSEAENLCVSGTRRQGHVDIYSWVDGMWWTGEEYLGVCLDKCETEDRPGEKEIRQRIKAYGDCSTAPVAPE
jgi:hypothetical protein